MSKKKSTIPNTNPSFEFVFGGFKQKETPPIECKIVKGHFKRKYPSEARKLCKNVFPEEEKQSKK
ncbi:MAG: hypothetical protein IJB90_05580 [Clostridia bacterium]|nr:hypothetical protein [Clostridia bacterium]